MKITLAYIAGEERAAALIQRFAERLVDDVEVITSKRRDGICGDGFHEVAVPREEGGERDDLPTA